MSKRTTTTLRIAFAHEARTAHVSLRQESETDGEDDDDREAAADLVARMRIGAPAVGRPAWVARDRYEGDDDARALDRILTSLVGRPIVGTEHAARLLVELLDALAGSSELATEPTEGTTPAADDDAEPLDVDPAVSS